MITVVLAILSLLGESRQELIKSCPPPEDIPECDCKWKGSLEVHCKELYNPWDLKSITSRLSKYNVRSLRLEDSFLMYWPKGMFHQLHLREIEMYNCEVLGLESDDGKEMFEGIEQTLDHLYFYNVTGMDTWRWSAFTALQALRTFSIRRGDLITLTKDFANISPHSLSVVRFSYNSIEQIHKQAFSNHVKLETWELEGNSIEVIDRGMLPKPATNLVTINLLQNKIKAIPGDFFTDMPNLKYFFMAWNRVKFLSQELFHPLQKGQRFVIDVRYNDIYCCEDLKFLVAEDYREVINGECNYPQELKNKAIRSLTDADLDHGFC